MTTQQYKRAVGTFPSRQAAEEALNELRNSGFSMDRVSVLAKDTEQNEQIAGTQVRDTSDNEAREGAGAGAVTGTVLGGVGGLLVGLGSLVVPGAGPFLAGILILLTEPFPINDQIVFKSFEGTVENIETRATTIRTYDGRRIVIPNSELFTNSVTVNTAFESRRLEYDVGIGYGDDIDRAKQLILEAMHSLDEVLQEPAPDVLVMELAESTVNIRARW